MKVYIVLSGHYSDTSIERVFLNKEKAEYWAEARNYVYDDDYRVEEYQTSDEKVDISREKKPVFHYTDDEWYWGDRCIATPGEVVDEDRWGEQRLHVFSETLLPDEKVWKIFHDMETRIKAEKAGIV